MYSCYLSVSSAVKVIDGRIRWIGFSSLVSRNVSDILVGLLNPSSEETLYKPALVEEARRKTSPRQTGGQVLQGVRKGFEASLFFLCPGSLQSFLQILPGESSFLCGGCQVAGNRFRRWLACFALIFLRSSVERTRHV